jgi:RimJ/RimL family protein N-acetyltransferase
VSSVAEIAEIVQDAPVWAYQNDRVIVVPYVDGNPSKAFSDEFLFFLYSQCKKDKILDILFPGMPMVTPARFVAYLKDRPILVGLVKPTFEVAEFGFIYEVEGPEGARKGTVGFAAFRKWWGSSEIKDMSRLALRWWFTEAKYNILFGTTLWRNRVAWRFSRELGFQSVGRVPMFFSKDGRLEDMHLLYATPETFRGEL